MISYLCAELVRTVENCKCIRIPDHNVTERIIGVMWSLRKQTTTTQSAKWFARSNCEKRNSQKMNENGNCCEPIKFIITWAFIFSIMSSFHFLIWSNEKSKIKIEREKNSEIKVRFALFSSSNMIDKIVAIHTSISINRTNPSKFSFRCLYVSTYLKDLLYWNFPLSIQ